MENAKNNDEAAREWDVLCEVLRDQDPKEAAHALDVRMSDAGMAAIMGMSVAMLLVAVKEKRGALLGMLKQFYVTAYEEMDSFP